MIPGRHYAGPVLIDLHTHSTASDGTEPPAVVVAQAVAAGLDVVALTDHDTTLAQAVAAAKTGAEERKALGFDQAALDDAARAGFAAGVFEESAEEGAAVVEEFYPDEEADGDVSAGRPLDVKSALAQKAAKLQRAESEPGETGPAR